MRIPDMRVLAMPLPAMGVRAVRAGAAALRDHVDRPLDRACAADPPDAARRVLCAGGGRSGRPADARRGRCAARRYRQPAPGARGWILRFLRSFDAPEPGRSAGLRGSGAARRRRGESRVWAAAGQRALWHASGRGAASGTPKPGWRRPPRPVPNARPATAAAANAPAPGVATPNEPAPSTRVAVAEPALPPAPPLPRPRPKLALNETPAAAPVDVPAGPPAAKPTAQAATAAPAATPSPAPGAAEDPAKSIE